MSALSPRGILVPDRPVPVFGYGLDAMRLRRCLSFIETAMSDDEAWGALFTEEDRLHTFRCVYGNRKGKRRSAAQQSFDLGRLS